MDCQEFEHQLHDALDQRRDPRTPELQAHSAACEPCGELLAGSLVLLRGVKAWRKLMPTVNFADRFEGSECATTSAESTLQKTPKRRIDGALSWGLLTATAAAVCLMLWAAPYPGNSPTFQPSLASQTPKSSAAIPGPSVPNADLKTVLVSAEGAYSHLAQETVAVAHDFALLMPSGGLFRSAEPLSSRPSQTPSNTSSLLPGDVYPVGDSVEDALRYLWKAVPHEGERGV